MRKKHNAKYDINEVYTMSPIVEAKLSVGVNKYTNEFKVQFDLNGANATLINVRDLKKYGHRSTSYSSDKMAIINQLELSKYDGGLFFSRELILDAVKHKGKISKNSINIGLFSIERNKFLLHIERVFINSSKPYKQSVSFYWVLDISPHKSKSDVRKYTFNDKPKYKLINSTLKRK